MTIINVSDSSPHRTMSEFDPLTSNTRPATDALITVRIIKSFPYRNVKNYVIPKINLKETTPTQLLEQVKQAINTQGSLRPYRNVEYDTIKVYYHPHETKSMNLVINFDDDDTKVLTSNDKKNTNLWDLGVTNETELSAFVWEDYQEYKKNPEDKWI